MSEIESKNILVGETVAAADSKTGTNQLRDQTHQQARIFEAMIFSLGDFAYAFDREHRFIFVNQALLDLWGITLEEAIGKTFFELSYPNGLAAKLDGQIRQVFEIKERVRDETLYVSPTGVNGYYEYIFNPVFASDGSVEFVIGTTRDITERKRSEEALRESDRRKDEFLATLAHELRNPLAPIRSGLEIIRRTGNEAAKIEEVLDIIERQTNQIVHLVDDLLDISRISQGKIKLKRERIELKSAIDLALETVRDAIESNGHHFALALPEDAVYLDADFTRVTQILLNLLNNAAKYTPPGGQIWLTVKKQAGSALISVKDTGIGIPPEMLPVVFDLFSQIESTSEQTRSGLGIGLSVVKKLVEMHGGSVTSLSAGAGMGSEFVVRMPLAADQAAAAKKILATDIAQIADLKVPSNGDKQSPEKRILVVDDNADAAEMLYFLLSGEGHQVRTEPDGETAIETAKTFQPEVCVLDIGLPQMDGYQLARHLRELMPQVKMIALSGWGQAEDRRRSQEAGFDYHLVKPVNLDDVKALLDDESPASVAQTK